MFFLVYVNIELVIRYGRRTVDKYSTKRSSDILQYPLHNSHKPLRVSVSKYSNA